MELGYTALPGWMEADGARDSTSSSAADDGEHFPPPPSEHADQTLLPHAGSNGHVTDAPPYWSRHGRTVSSASYHSIGQHRPTPILLEDHSEESHELSQGCWAKSASIDEYVLVSGPTGIGAYIVWHCTVQTLKGGDVVVRKR